MVASVFKNVETSHYYVLLSNGHTLDQSLDWAV